MSFPELIIGFIFGVFLSLSCVLFWLKKRIHYSGDVVIRESADGLITITLDISDDPMAFEERDNVSFRVVKATR